VNGRAFGLTPQTTLYLEDQIRAELNPGAEPFSAMNYGNSVHDAGLAQEGSSTTLQKDFNLNNDHSVRCSSKSSTSGTCGTCSGLSLRRSGLQAEPDDLLRRHRDHRPYLHAAAHPSAPLGALTVWTTGLDANDNWYCHFNQAWITAVQTDNSTPGSAPAPRRPGRPAPLASRRGRRWARSSRSGRRGREERHPLPPAPHRHDEALLRQRQPPGPGGDFYTVLSRLLVRLLHELASVRRRGAGDGQDHGRLLHDRQPGRRRQPGPRIPAGGLVLLPVEGKPAGRDPRAEQPSVPGRGAGGAPSGTTGHAPTAPRCATAARRGTRGDRSAP
jgi:hypothetical protein